MSDAEETTKFAIRHKLIAVHHIIGLNRDGVESAVEAVMDAITDPATMWAFQDLLTDESPTDLTEGRTTGSTEVFIKIGEIEGNVWEGLPLLLLETGDGNAEVVFRERGEYHPVHPDAIDEAFKRLDTMQGGG